MTRLSQQKRLVVVLLGCLALALLAATPASAGGWLPPDNLSEETQPEDFPQVAADPAGDTIIAWEHKEGELWSIQSALRPVGGAWEEPVEVSETGHRPQIAMDDAGDAIAVWRASDGSNELIQSAFRPAGAKWEAPVTISAKGHNSFSPRLAMNAAGDAVAVWAEYEEGVAKSIEGAFRPAGGQWQGGLAVADVPPDWNPDVAIDGAGNALAVWRTYSPSLDECLVQSAFRPAGGEWEGQPQTIAFELYPGKGPRLTMNAVGDAAAVWGRYQGPPREKKPGGSPSILCDAEKGATEEVRGSFKLPGGEWGGAVPISDREKGEYPEVAIDASGKSIVVWQASGVIQSASPNGPVTISDEAANSIWPQLAMNARGEAVVTWLASPAGNDVAQAAVRSAAGSWAPSHDISSSGRAGEPIPAIDASGNATATWVRHTPATETVQTATYDATGPKLEGLSIPSTGTAGEPLSFSVSPLDTWSALGETSWDFGDGTTSLGTSVTHTYSAPGSYHVTLSSADAVGNTTLADGTVTIGPGADPSPAPTISKLEQSSPVWREPGSPPSASSSRLRRIPLGTTFTFVLNQGATVKLSFHRIGKGHAGALTMSGHSGMNRTGFKGKITASKRLRPGRYTLTATAVNRNGSSAPRSLGFRIVKRG